MKTGLDIHRGKTSVNKKPGKSLRVFSCNVPCSHLILASLKLSGFHI